MSRPPPDRESVNRILAAPRTRPFRRLRDHAAYMLLTGTYPSHLWPYSTRLLVLISANAPGALAHSAGAVRLIDPEIAEALGLANHPMVEAVREHLAQGYRIRVSQGPNERKPYSKVWLFKAGEEITIQIDGTRTQGWV